MMPSLSSLNSFHSERKIVNRPTRPPYLRVNFSKEEKNEQKQKDP